MFDEMNFLFATSGKISKQFNAENDSSRKNLGSGDQQVTNTNDSAQSVKNKIEHDDTDDTWKFNKYVITNSEINNYIKSNVNAAYKKSGKNPYIDLLEKFNGEGTNPKSLKIKATDLSYLRDIGVYPINRLMILRRYPEGVVVPVDLTDLDVEPISTIIGWVKAEDDLLNYNVNEVWKTQNKMLHVLMREIIQSEFGFDIGGIFPVPGWGTGFMFGLLNKMGLTDYSQNNLPIGDADLLREGITRAHEEQGLQSTFTFNLETVFEQKYIGGVDAGAAMTELRENADRMGTSDMKFLGKAGNKLAKALREANNNPSNPDGWKKLIISTVTSVVDALNGVVRSAVRKEEKNSNAPTQEEEDTEQKKKSKDLATQEGHLKKIGIVRSLISSVLASTIARYQWPIRGSLNQLTGEAATPWHLTIGNPYAPLLSINNIKVSTLDVTFGNELAYNDMSKYMTVKVNMEQGRNFGKQEISKMFGVEYRRKYKKV